MPIRITQSGMYDSLVKNMQNSLSGYMTSIEQGSSQKQVNAPSDDPAAMTRILNTRHTIAVNKQQQVNVDTGKGWLELADKTLTQTSTVVTNIKALAEQAATGTYDATNRQQISFEIKQLFESLVNLANTRYEDKSLFAGHKYVDTAFDMGLSVTTWDENLSDVAWSVSGATDHSYVVQFLSDGEVGTDALNYRYSKDSGSTWVEGTLAAGSNVMDMDGVSLTVPKGTRMTAAKDPDSHSAEDGSFLYIRPAAVYNGDTNDVTTRTSIVGGTPGMKAEATGNYKSNVIVQIDSGADLSQAGKPLTYSYSRDAGATWTVAEVNTPDPAADTIRLPLSDGYVDLSFDGAAADKTITAGTQVLIHPDRADLNYEIGEKAAVTVNNVGKDVYGGVYLDGETGTYRAALTEETNLLEIVGDLIAYAENNNQTGCQKCLDLLTSAQNNILTQAARIGGMENRIDVATTILKFQKDDLDERLSYMEDIDLTELLTKLTQQQTAYQTVLKTSSTIMNISLMDYL